MEVNAFFPKDPLLKRYIAYYYFLKTDENFNVRYYSFPDLTTPLNIHKNIEVKIGQYHTAITRSKNPNNVMLVQGMRRSPLLVDLKGRLDKITIHFKPLGLNHFIKSNFGEVAKNDSQLFVEWNTIKGFDDFIEKFYATNNSDGRIALLEQFLISIYHPIEINPAFENALNMLVNFDDELSIEDVANRCQISIKTLDRFFKKHIGTSPVSFKKIARFRHSLNNKLSSEERKTLTNICYESNFYDQAYFNNVYKQISGSNPGDFFKTLSKLADDNLIFRFLNQGIVS